MNGADDAADNACQGGVAVLGGTFDPIHFGHLRSALELRERLGCGQVRLIPCHRPPHRDTPAVSGEQRLRMVELAVAGDSGLVADARELRRPGPSYTIDTLIELRAELGARCPLYLVMGVDAFALLDGWWRWRELLDFAHIVVIARPDCALPQSGAVAGLLAAHGAAVDTLRTRSHGGIATLQLTPLPISATAIRALIRAGRSPRYLLPDAVQAFISAQRLYC